MMLLLKECCHVCCGSDKRRVYHVGEWEEEEGEVMQLSSCAGHVRPWHSKIHDHKVQALE